MQNVFIKMYASFEIIISKHVLRMFFKINF